MRLQVTTNFVLETWLRIMVTINLQVVVELLRVLQLKERPVVSIVVERAKEAVVNMFVGFYTAGIKFTQRLERGLGMNGATHDKTKQDNTIL